MAPAKKAAPPAKKPASPAYKSGKNRKGVKGEDGVIKYPSHDNGFYRAMERKFKAALKEYNKANWDPKKVPDEELVWPTITEYVGAVMSMPNHAKSDFSKGIMPDGMEAWEDVQPEVVRAVRNFAQTCRVSRGWKMTPLKTEKLNCRLSLMIIPDDHAVEVGIMEAPKARKAYTRRSGLPAEGTKGKKGQAAQAEPDDDEEDEEELDEELDEEQEPEGDDKGEEVENAEKELEEEQEPEADDDQPDARAPGVKQPKDKMPRSSPVPEETPAEQERRIRDRARNARGQTEAPVVKKRPPVSDADAQPFKRQRLPDSPFGSSQDKPSVPEEHANPSDGAQEKGDE